MSAYVKLSAALPGDPETNGVDDLADVLVGNPKTIRYGVVWFDVVKVIEDIDSGDNVPVIRVRRIEPLGVASSVDPAISDVVATAVEARTGRPAMPFEIVEVDRPEGDPDQLTIDDAGEEEAAAS